MNGHQAALPVVKAAELGNCENVPKWLIQGLWMAAAVGIVGGPPKSWKTWLMLDIAISLASKTPCLGLFMPTKKGRVLLYAAEDSQAIIRQRLDSISRHRGVELKNLDIYVITAPRLRLDLADDQRKLDETVRSLKPDMLLLDPLVRLHCIDENSAGEVSALLAYLRELQRQHQLAVILVHHTRKNGSAGHPGLALRGSSDIHAWSDCSIYLQRRHEQLILVTENRAAPVTAPVELSLVPGDNPHLEAMGVMVIPKTDDLAQAILEAIANEDSPITRNALRNRLRVQNKRLGDALALLEQQKLISRTKSGWINRSVPDPLERSKGTEHQLTLLTD